MNKLYSIALFLLASSVANAQDEIETAPDQYENPNTTPAGRFQMENRFTIQDAGTDSRSLILPSTNWKFGIHEQVEVIVVTDFVFDKTADSTTNGLQPLKLGLKIKLWNSKGILPDAAITMQLSIPKLASKDWKEKYLAPNFRMLFKNKINDKISLGYNIGSIWDGEVTDPQFFYTVSPKYKLSQKLECFVEAYGYYRKTSVAENWTDAGLMYLITNDIQAELSAGYELSAANGSHQYFGLAGIAFRI
jgi:hypothetical protein